MKDRPLLFSGEMVRAILEGRKTQTRRVVKPPLDTFDGWDFHDKTLYVFDVDTDPVDKFNKSSQKILKCPYGKPGDRLWVRENCYIHGHWTRTGTGLTKSGKSRWQFVPTPHSLQKREVYFPDSNPLPHPIVKSKGAKGWFLRPSIFMPQWASRLTLEITNVKVERLQDISEEDALAEGVTGWTEPRQVKIPVGLGTQHGRQMQDGNIRVKQSPIYQFQDFWESINGPSSWENNPWVWVIEFRRFLND